MRYGLIGEKLGHSFSKIIHEQLADYTYDLIPLSKEDVHSFMVNKEFAAINVTIPYKQTVMDYLDEINDAAKEIGAVNTIVNRDGKLCGYNTDYYGFRYMLERHNIEIEGKKVLVLGRGGASKAVIAVLKDLGAKDIFTIYHKPHPETLSYEECYLNHSDAHMIVNTTPVGMYPNGDGTPIDLAPFTALEAVVDVVYNPLRTRLLLDGIEKGVSYVGGLEVLIAQAKYAVEIFLDIKIKDEQIDQIYRNLLKERSNLVLIGMSGCGKSILGELAAQRLGKTFVDGDDEIVKKIGMSIYDYFQLYGESEFRDREEEVFKELSEKSNQVISTSGGAVTRKANINRLKGNGRVMWIQRDLSLLHHGEGRPLAPNLDAVKKLYESRQHLYSGYAEVIAMNDFSTHEEGVDSICNAFQAFIDQA